MENVGFRATTLRDPNGHSLAVPNRRLLTMTTVVDEAPWPELEITVRVAPALPLRGVHEALIRLVLSSPWIAPGQVPVVVVDDEQAGLWRVRARLLAGRYADEFEGALREQIAEGLVLT